MSQSGGAEQPSLIDIDSTFLPVGQMRQISRVTQLDGSVIVGDVDLGQHWVYPQHFPRDPVFPGTLMIEAAGQLVALWAWANGRRGKPRLVKVSAEFRSPIGPEIERLTLRAEVTQRRKLHFGEVTLSNSCDEVGTVSLVLAVIEP